MIAIDKARTQIENAKVLLRNNANPEDGLYQYRKYVKRAGLIAYKGLLLSLVKLLKHNKKDDLIVIEQGLSKLDKGIFADFITAQQVLSRSMGIYGTRSQQLAELGISEAEKIITWVEKSVTKI
ncbi:DUF5618 family protein [Dyadobacter subterraneus]|uniref:DUF5618 family protein n=1 Tax=Dyadobacter subterraneus TaxID=2773304 RepID=A0ABR9WPD3_9BACT|nr:DUF5618 family protein [Dyadobacter subterraneus]MBE9465994.1 DUF5618 family protein [Dyadobacter subterraneus]